MIPDRQIILPINIINDYVLKTPDSKRYERIIDLIDSDKYIENITGNRNTDFSRSSNGKERSSRIDYIWCNEMLASKCLSCQIINFERLSIVRRSGLFTFVC